MSSWAQAKPQVLNLEISPHGVHGGPMQGGQPHVGVGYQIVLPPARVVHRSGLSLHGPGAEGRTLPPELLEAVRALWAYAEQQVSEREGVEP
jgi:hypothetical protein